LSWLDKVLDRIGLIRKSSVIPEFHAQGEPQKRVPKWSLKKLYQVVENSWVLQEIFRAIIQEVKRPGWRIEPRFAVKCGVCGYESPVPIEECPICGAKKKLNKPDPRQYQRAVELLRHPNGNRESFGDILGSITYHDLVADDWFISIGYGPRNDREPGQLIPKEIKVEHPAYIKPIIDEFGNLGIDEYFCPVCFNYKHNPQIFPKPGYCPKCGTELQRTAYIQEIDGEITARFSVNQIVHGSTHRVLPSYFGTPRAKSLWYIIHILQAMDEWFFDMFTEGRLHKIINFPGFKQHQITELMRRIEAERRRLTQVDPRTGLARAKKNLALLLLASQEPISVHDVSISPQDISALDYYRLCIQACAGVYGVQAIFISFVEKGKAGTTPAMQIEVQNRTIEEIQRDKEEIFNEQLFPIFGITDWVFKFNPLEKKDRLREAEIEQRLASAIATYRAAGFEVWFDDFGNLKKSQKPVSEPTRVRPIGSAGPKRKISGASGMEILGTTTEREPHGPRPPNPALELKQDDERDR